MPCLQGGEPAHGAAPVRGPYRRQKPDVCAGYALTPASSALHTPCGSQWCLESLVIHDVARCHASMAVNPPHVVIRFNGRLRAVKSAVRALFAENPGYRAWSSLYDATKCFKSRGTDGSARCHTSAAMNHQLGTPPSMGPLRAVKSAVRATYGENAGSRACHSSCGPPRSVYKATVSTVRPVETPRWR